MAMKVSTGTLPMKRTAQVWKVIPRLASVLAALLLANSASAFSLSAPPTSWMSQLLGYQMPGDVGTPALTGEEYRWNVPLLTYGFDAAFEAEFGTNGIASVDKVFSDLTALPSVNEITNELLTNTYPKVAVTTNAAAASDGIYDLRSTVLARVLEHLGLANAHRYSWTLRSRFLSNGLTNWVVINRSFDPITFVGSGIVNGFTNSYAIQERAYPNPFVPLAVDPLTIGNGRGIAGNLPGPGEAYTNLTVDDIGGLRYLYRSNNVNLEQLPAGVSGIGGQPFVNSATRGGIGKLAFVRHPTNGVPGQFLSFTNQFIDRYLSGSTVLEQALVRIVQRPDILFIVTDPATNAFRPLVEGSGTEEWKNSDPTRQGPGVIQGQARIAVRRLGPLVTTNGIQLREWGEFDSAKVIWTTRTNHPSQDVSADLLVARQQPLKLSFSGSPTNGQPLILQQSTNLIDWITFAHVTNRGAKLEWLTEPTTNNIFFRIVTPSP